MPLARSSHSLAYGLTVFSARFLVHETCLTQRPDETLLETLALEVKRVESLAYWWLVYLSIYAIDANYVSKTD